MPDEKTDATALPTDVREWKLEGKTSGLVQFQGNKIYLTPTVTLIITN